MKLSESQINALNGLLSGPANIPAVHAGKLKDAGYVESTGEASGQRVAEVKGISKAFGERVLVKDFSTRIMRGELRTGALEGVLVDAIARAAGDPVSTVRRAAMLSGVSSYSRCATGAGPRAPLNPRTITVRAMTPWRKATVSPQRRSRAGLACWPLTVTRPLPISSVARLRVL